MSELSTLITCIQPERLCRTSELDRIGWPDYLLLVQPLEKYFKWIRLTEQETNHLTMLFSVGSALLYYAVDCLGIEEMRPWKEIELGSVSALLR